MFDLKSAAMSLVAVVVQTPDLEALGAELERRFGDSPLFDNDLVVIDLAAVAEHDIDLSALAALLRRHRMQPVAVRGAGAAQREQAQALGLGEAPDAPPARAAAPAPSPAIEAQLEPEAPAPTAAEPAAAPGRTLVIDRPLRSGQQVYARGGDLVVLSVVSFGAEVIADGHIHVYAPLRGRAIAGAQGNTEARIFAASMEPQLVSIAGIYRTTETELPPDVRGKPAQVRLEGERLVVEPLKH
jgi:septum site-determining protein MinC